MEPFKDTTEGSERAAFRTAGVYEASSNGGNLSERYTNAADAIKHIAAKVAGTAKLTFFVSERRGEKSSEFGLVWAFAKDLAISASAAVDATDSDIKVYRPSRDFRMMEITGHDAMHDAPFHSASTLKVKVLGHGSQFMELEASGNNCAALYDLLPSLFGTNGEAG